MSTPASEVAGLEGALDHLDVGGGTGPERHAGHVEPHVGETARRRLLPQPPGGQAPEAALLLARARLGPGPEAGPRPGLDLAEDDAPGPRRHEIELALPAAPVPG